MIKFDKKRKNDIRYCQLETLTYVCVFKHTHTHTFADYKQNS